MLSSFPPSQEVLDAGTKEHYEDAILYDYEYRKRREDITYYRNFVRKFADTKSIRVLELGCGTGRLLVPLLRDGHTIVGVDRSRPMLSRCAKRLTGVAANKRSRASLIQADFRSLPIINRGLGQFPLILCPFNAFMHLYSRSDVEKFLHQVKIHLSPQGAFVFDLLNPDLDWLCRNPNRRYAKTRFTHPSTEEILFYTTNHLYDPVHQIAYIRIYYEPAGSYDSSKVVSLPSQQTKVVHLAHRQFFPAELEAILFYNGFAIERREGDFDGQPFSLESQQQIIHTRLL